VITTEQNELADALARNSQLREKVVATLITKGLKAEDINTSKFSTSPQFGWFGKSPKSYQIVNRMAINITDEKQLQEIARLSDSNEAIELSGTKYQHSKKKAFIALVKKKALQDVMQQKQFYETALGVKLTTKSFRDSNLGFGGTLGSQAFADKIVITGSRKKRQEVSSFAPNRTQQSQSFDEVEYKAEILVDFIVDSHE